MERPDPETEDLVVDVPERRGDYGDDFYKRAADRYALAAIHFAAPAPKLAEANDVPLSTVHRWVKEARRRGFLGASRPGKSG